MVAAAPTRPYATRSLRDVADSAFSRAAGAQLIGGNKVSLLRDGPENYPRWLEAIESAKDHVHLEVYFMQADRIGERFREALIRKATQGVEVRVLFDWLGNFRKAPASFWKSLRAAGVEVRAYNPPRLSRPLGWLSRDHRKMLAVDHEVGFVTGLCIGDMWMGDPSRNLEPWRDTGVEIHGPAVAELERAFARMWRMTGEPLAPSLVSREPAAQVGDISVRIVSSEPASASMLRIDQLVAALARERLWLTDAYYAGTSSYVQALRGAAKDGVDVRLLVPNATDLPLLKPLSRSGYRALLEAGVRVFEWNGSMVHAKTAVADRRWARVGSTNLNVASWLGNCELDAIIEDENFAAQMEDLYLRDLENATEIVLTERRKLHSQGQPRRPRLAALSGGAVGSTTRATAGAVRLGNAIGAVLANRRVLGPIEARLMVTSGVLGIVVAVLIALFPRAVAYPLAVLGAWSGLALLYRGVRLYRKHKPSSSTPTNS